MNPGAQQGTDSMNADPGPSTPVRGKMRDASSNGDAAPASVPDPVQAISQASEIFFPGRAETTCALCHESMLSW